MDQVKAGELIRNRRSSSSDNRASDCLDPDSDIERETVPFNLNQNVTATNFNYNSHNKIAIDTKEPSSSDNDSTRDQSTSQSEVGSGKQRVAASTSGLVIGRSANRQSKAIRSRTSYLRRKSRFTEVDGNGAIRIASSGKVGKRKRSGILGAGNKSDSDNDHDGDVDNSDNNNDEDSYGKGSSSSSSSSVTIARGYNDDSNLSFGHRRREYIINSSRLEQGKPVVRARKMQRNGREEVSSNKSTHQHHHQVEEPISQETNLALSKDHQKYNKLGKIVGQPVAQETNSQLNEQISGSFLPIVFRKPILFLKNTLSISQDQGTHHSTGSIKTTDIILHDRQKHTTQADMPNNENNYQTIQVLDESQGSRWRQREKFREQRSGSNGYTKLNHHQQYYQSKYSKKPTILQELLRLLLLLLIISISCLLLWQLYKVLIEEYNYLGAVETPSELGVFKQYAVSTDAEPCAKVGEELLAKGGSAVDASIGTLICMGVVIPNSLGLGGGCLMTLYDAKKREAVVIDGREIAPDYASENMFANVSLKASRGPLSVGVPGELAAYWKAHQMFGKLPWSELFNRSIDMAEYGSPIVEHLAFALRDFSHAKYITPPLAKIFFNNKTGEYLDEGEMLIQKELANSLRRIRDFGAPEFYGGLTGQKFIKDLADQGGQMTLENLIKYEALVREPITIDLDKNLKVFTQPPPGSGIVLSIILRIMKELGYYKNLTPQVSFDSASIYYHRLVEAFKFAYGQRAALEDDPDPKLMEKLKSDEFIRDAVSKIDNFAHNNSHYGAMQYFSEDHGTAHVSVLDSEGNAAAITTSVNLYFGSGLISPSTGIIYNDVMDDFVSPKIVNKFGLAPSKFNRIRPGKRPLSSMAPSVFTDGDGKVRLIIGGSGGSKITTAIASVCIRNCFLGEDIKTAIDGPRIHHQFLPNSINYEKNIPRDLLQSLVDRGHSISPIVGRSSVIMAIASEEKENGTRCITANSDYRKGGSVAGL